MATTPEQRKAFGARLRTLRTSGTFLNQEELGAAIGQHGGKAVSAAAVSEYERGVSAPDAASVAAIELLLGEPAGSLAGLLGYRGDDPSMEARVSGLERQMEELLRLLRQLPNTPLGVLSREVVSI